jgi:predicted flap endonuclease-1-like 5' DNA nuclease
MNNWGNTGQLEGHIIMTLDRSAKTFIAVFTLVAGLLLAINHIIDEAPFGDWGLAIVLLAISAAFWAWVWRDDVDSKAIVAVDDVDGLPKAHEWIISKESVAAPPKSASTRTQSTPKPASASAPKASATDDLTRIEGIGPKYQDALNASGIATFAQVANSNEAALTDIVRNAGMRRPVSIVSWAQQATLAAKGDWTALEKLQDSLTGGRR